MAECKRHSIWQGGLLALSYFWSSLWVRQSEKQSMEDLDTGDYLRNNKIIFDYVMKSLAHSHTHSTPTPQCCIQKVSASLPSREMAAGLERWDRKWYLFVLCRCPALNVLLS